MLAPPLSLYQGFHGAFIPQGSGGHSVAMLVYMSHNASLATIEWI
jgi:hypothetical protein